MRSVFVHMIATDAAKCSVHNYIGVRVSPERDISSLGTLVDGGWTGLGRPSAAALERSGNPGSKQLNET